MDKKKIQQLKRRRKTLEKKITEIGPVLRGSVVELGATCGNPNCRCTRGEKHLKYYFSMSLKGKTKLIYLGKSRAPFAQQYLKNYKILLAIVEEMSTINLELLKAGVVQKLN